MTKRKRLVMGHVEKVYERKEHTDGGDVMIGIVEGYLATWEIDRIDDQFIKGSFAETIKEHQDRERPLRLKRNHWNLIGGFPAESLREDDTGLYGIAEINLLVQEGREAYMLAKQGVLSDFSVAVSIKQDDFEVEDGITKYLKVKLWEASLVDEPMNPGAVATAVRGAVSVSSLPSEIADVETIWDADAAIDHMRVHTDSINEPSDTYKKGFLWFDETEEDSFGAYKMPVVDIVDGEPQVVPRAVFAAAAALEGARGGVDLPDEDRAKVIATVNALYEKMDMESPLDKGMWSAPELRALPKSAARYIIAHKKLSRDAVKLVVEAVQSGDGTHRKQSVKESSDAQESINELSKTLRGAWSWK